jgi:hypothetical protein
MRYDLYEPDNWHPNYQPLTTMFYSNLHTLERKNNFLVKTRIFTDNLLREADTENRHEYILFDQAIPVISFSNYLNYFTSLRVIIVDRDPRDIYVMNKAFWGSGYIPTSNVELFIKWYSETRQPRNIGLSELEADSIKRVIFLPFESLIYEYDDSLKRVMAHTGLTTNEHINKLKYFNPELSIKNTQVFLDFPELKNDIDLIEKHLEEYCYPFPVDSHTRKTSHIFIEKINQEFTSSIESKKISIGLLKYAFPALFRITKLYRNIQAIKKDKDIRFKDIIKICIKFFIFPFEMIFYLVQLLFCRNN